MARKNGVDRKLYPIEGGVCAPNGFSANAVHAGFKTSSEEYDLALVVSDKRCPAAAVFSTSALVGAPITVSKRHLKYGLSYGIIINSGIANIYQEDGEELSKQICQTTANLIKVDRADIMIASTGKIGPRVTFHNFEQALKPLTAGLQPSHENSFRAAQAIMTTDKKAKQLSYRFDLGDFPCKIGAIFKGSQRVSPNMATTLGVITTDVNISSEMLQRAFSAAAKDTLNLLDMDGVASPNDMFCIMANGRAGNCKIESADSEYKKFCYILREFMLEICKEIARDGISGKVLVCRVLGVKSKQVSRAIAKKLASSLQLKRALAENRMDKESVFCAITDVDIVEDFSELCMAVKTEKGKIVFCEEGKVLLFNEEIMKNYLDVPEMELIIDFRKGNFASKAISGI